LKIKDIVKCDFLLRLTGRYMLRRLRLINPKDWRATQNSSRACARALERPLCGFAPPHFFAPVKMLRIFPYRAQKNVIYRQNVMRQAGLLVGKIDIKIYHKLTKYVS